MCILRDHSLGSGYANENRGRPYRPDIAAEMPASERFRTLRPLSSYLNYKTHNRIQGIPHIQRLHWIHTELMIVVHGIQ